MFVCVCAHASQMQQHVDSLRKGHIDAKKKARSSVRIQGSKAVSVSRETTMAKVHVYTCV